MLEIKAPWKREMSEVLQSIISHKFNIKWNVVIYLL